MEDLMKHGLGETESDFFSGDVSELLVVPLLSSVNGKITPNGFMATKSKDDLPIILCTARGGIRVFKTADALLLKAYSNNILNIVFTYDLGGADQDEESE